MDLWKLCEELRREIECLKAEVKRLEIENENLRAENKALKIENAELKERLGLNSKNSSIPSSKDLYKVYKKKPKSGKKIGAQVGHKGNYRPKMEADEMIKIELSSTCECGGEFAISRKPYIHQKVDIPEIRPYVVEYQLEHGRCKKCGKRRSGKLPKNVTPDVFGPRIKSVIAALSGFYKNSKREITSIINDIFNLNISVGSISNSEFRVAAKCKQKYEQIAQEIKESNVLHIDETSHYNKGKQGWCWMFSSKEAGFVKLANSRGMKVLKGSIFFDYQSLVVTDRYAAYNHFAKEKKADLLGTFVKRFQKVST